MASNLEAVENFRARLSVLPFDENAAAYYGELHATLEQAGMPIGPYNLMIAGPARSEGMTWLPTTSGSSTGSVAFASNIGVANRPPLPWHFNPDSAGLSRKTLAHPEGEASGMDPNAGVDRLDLPTTPEKVWWTILGQI